MIETQYPTPPELGGIHWTDNSDRPPPPPSAIAPQDHQGAIAP
ncbi:hypothetical protein VB712_08645 [Spirulina sp. CCNP1310]|nr:hypothetical protein [Spirulina sp. CCNP1310]MEA5419296.1 hypothetical protein [Spirulina sp. CCNP1310]